MHTDSVLNGHSVALRHSILLFFVAVLLTVLAGCSETSQPDVVRPELAKETLVKALDAWKAGSKIDSLQAQSPSIVVQDRDWTAGKKLQGYSLNGEGRSVGANLSIEVELTLADASGKVATSKVWYLVGTDPALTVFRDMLHL